MRNIFLIIFSVFFFSSGFFESKKPAHFYFREIASVKKVGVLFGTFDPPHLGHKNLALEMQKKFGLDIVYFIPRDKADYKPGKQPIGVRNKLVELLLQDNPSLKLIPPAVALKMKDIRSEEAFFTLRESFPKDKISLILGDDTLMSLHNNQVRIPDGFQILVSTRAGNESLELPTQLDGKPVFLMKGVGDSSSTKVRKILSEGGMPEMLPINVYHYIQEQKLYQAMPVIPKVDSNASCVQIISNFISGRP